MKKNTIKAFTLVEMLIVIVIIGILIAALMPRMQSAQWRARDVARKNDLSQIQTAIVTSQQDKGNWPGMKDTLCDAAEVTGTTGSCTNGKFDADYAPNWIDVSMIAKALTTAGLSSVPTDPLAANKVSWLDSHQWQDGQYIYMVTTRNGTSNGWFVLMAKTEIEWWSNWAVKDWGTELKDGHIWASQDLKNVHPCTKLTKVDSGFDVSNSDDCKYTEEWQLRYILVY